MLVLLSDPALPGKAPRGGVGGAASLRARPRRPAGTPGHRTNRAGAPRFCGAKVKPWGGSASARSGARISQKGEGRRLPAARARGRGRPVGVRRGRDREAPGSAPEAAGRCERERGCRRAAVRYNERRLSLRMERLCCGKIHGTAAAPSRPPAGFCRGA